MARITPVALTLVLAFDGATPRTVGAQALYGSIVGTVTDGTDAPFPGATITATHVDTKQTRQHVAVSISNVVRIDRGQSYFDPLAFAPVTEARFGTAGFNTIGGPGLVNLDLGIARNFRVGHLDLQFRGEALNATNTPHFANPSGTGLNVSNMQLNQDGSIRSLGGFSEIRATAGTEREGVDERVFSLGLRVRF